MIPKKASKASRKEKNPVISEQEKTDFNIPSLLEYQQVDRKVALFNKNVRTLLTAIICITALIFSLSIYAYKDKFIIVTDKSYYQTKNESTLAEVFAKNFAIDLLEFDKYDVTRKVNDIIRQSINNSSSEENIKSLIAEKYFSITGTLNIIRKFEIDMDDKRNLDISTQYNSGVYYTTIKGIQSNINEQGIEKVGIEINIESVPFSINRKNPEGFKVRNFKSINTIL